VAEYLRVFCHVGFFVALNGLEGSPDEINNLLFAF